MPKAKEKHSKPGRNEPCWCGSGKKYKECHLPIEDAQRTDQRKLRQAQDTLLPKIMHATQSVAQAFPAALACFWQDRYTLEQMEELDDLEDRGANRFLTWFAFDYRLDDGHTLVETLAAAADQGSFEVDTYESRLLHMWKPVRLRPYIVEQIRKGHSLTVRNLLDQEIYIVEDHAAARRLEVGEALVGHLVPVSDQPASLFASTMPLEAGHPGGGTLPEAPAAIYCITGAVAQLTQDTQETLVEFAKLHLQDLRRSQPDAELSDLPYQRSYIFNHFVLSLPTEHTPGILEGVLLQTRTALHLAGLPLGRTEVLDSENEHNDND